MKCSEIKMCTIRNIEEKDVSRVAEIHVRSWQVAYKGILPQEFLDNLSIKQRETLWRNDIFPKMGRSNYVLEVAGNVLGWVSVGPSRDDDADENIIGELYGIYLDPQFYRIGYGTKLWREAKQYLFRNGFNKITLWVLEENVRARRFYEKIGFILEKDAVKELDWLDGAKEVRYRYNIV